MPISRVRVLEFRVRIWNDANEPVDVTSFVRSARWGLGDVSSVGTGSLGVDATVATASVTLLRDESLVELFRDYARIVIEGRATPRGSTPGSLETLFDGFLGDGFRWTGSNIELTARDPAKLLQDTQLDNITSYGSETGTPAEVVIQQIMTQNLGALAPTLYVPAATGALVREYLPRDQSVWDAIQAVVARFGWYLGYVRADGLYRLTLMEPPRGSLPPPNQFVLGADDLIAEDLDWSTRDVRNSVTVEYTDEATGEIARLTMQDEDSILNVTGGVPKHSHITLAGDSGVNTLAEAQRLAEAFLADLSTALSNVQVTIPFSLEPTLFTELIVNNQVRGGGPQTYSVNSVEHEVNADGRYRTTVLASGQVRGGLRKWLDREPRPGSPGDTGSHVTQLRAPTLSAVTAPPGVFVRAANGSPDAVALELHASMTPGFTPDAGTLVLSGPSNVWTLTDLEQGEMWYFRAREVDARGGLGPWSAEASAMSGEIDTEIDPDILADIAYANAAAIVLNASRDVWDRSQVITEDLRILRETIEGDLNQDLADMNSSLGTVESDLQSAQGRLDAAEGDISAVEGRVSTAELNITNLDGELASKADASVVDTIAGTVSDHSTAITQNATDIALKADATVVDTLAGTVSDHSTAITQNANEIASKAEASVVDSLSSTVSNHSTQITQNATDITQRATVTQFNSLTGRVDSHDTLIQQNAEDILLRATNAELGVVEDDLSAAVTRIDTAEVAINAHGVSIQAVESSVDDLGDDLVSAWSAINVASDSITTTVAKLGLPPNPGLPPGHVDQFSAIKQLSDSLSFVVADVSALEGLVESIESGYALEPMTTVNGEAMTTVGSVAMTTSVVQGLAAVFTAIAMNQNQIDAVASASADHYSLIQQNASAITQRVTQGAFNTTISQLSDEINLRVSKSGEGALTAINLDSSGVKISGNRIAINTDFFTVSGSGGVVSIANGAIKAAQIDANAVTASKIQAGAITTEKLTASEINISTTGRTAGRITARDAQGNRRAAFGNVSGLFGAPSGAYGFAAGLGDGAWIEGVPRVVYANRISGSPQLYMVLSASPSYGWAAGNSETTILDTYPVENLHIGASGIVQWDSSVLYTPPSGTSKKYAVMLTNARFTEYRAGTGMVGSGHWSAAVVNPIVTGLRGSTEGDVFTGAGALRIRFTYQFSVDSYPQARTITQLLPSSVTVLIIEYD